MVAYPTLRERLAHRLGVMTAEPSLRVSGVAKDSLELLILLECKVELRPAGDGPAPWGTRRIWQVSTALSFYAAS